MEEVPANASDAAKSRVGGIVLCGGQSTRMGRPKLSLPFAGELMLPRIVRILSQVVQPIVVVAAPDQELPALPEGVLITRDDRPHDGPLRGIACGLQRLQGLADAAYVSSCDVPLLKPEFVREMIARLGDHEIAVPDENGFVHPLAGVYRTHLAAKAREILDAGGRRPLSLIEQSRSLRADVNELRSVDPSLDSLRNLNTLEDYEAAVKDDTVKS
jgi:molybdopterin-guanine dinucleotide biosynthesis protein A